MVDATPIIELIYAFRRSKAMFAAVELDVFDRLEKSGAPASEFRGNTDAVERLLDTCVAMGLLSKAGALYSNTPMASAYLVSTSPATLAGYIQYSNRALYPMWGELEQALETGENRWQQTFGFGSNQLFEQFFRTEEAKRTFIAGMHGFGLLCSPAVVRAFDLSRFKKLVDLGGATGHLALAAIEQYPNLKAAVFDLPVVIPVTREYAGDRLELFPGDFFNDPLPPADLYAVGRIIHDWSEPKIKVLLARIFEALPSGGALLIAEKILDPAKTSPLDGLLQSLNMLVATEGKERSLAEFTELLEGAGFIDVQGSHTGCLVDAILASKP
jgi:acetylserotonin O-methyltransferase